MSLKMLKHFNSILQKTLVFIVANMSSDLQAADDFYIHNRKDCTKIWISFIKDECCGEDTFIAHAVTYPESMPTRISSIWTETVVIENESSGRVYRPEVSVFDDWEDDPILSHTLLTRLLERQQPQTDYVILPFLFYTDGNMASYALLSNLNIEENEGNN